MATSTVKKVNSADAPQGAMGQKYLASGKSVSMRLWQGEPAGESCPATERQYEVVGYVISGEAELNLAGQTIFLEPGDCWVVPAGARHSYHIRKEFTAIEATCPPAHVHARDEQPTGRE